MTKGEKEKEALDKLVKAVTKLIQPKEKRETPEVKGGKK